MLDSANSLVYNKKQGYIISLRGYLEMLCDECKINQAVYYKIVDVNGRRSEKRLCAACRKKSEDFSNLKFSGLGSLFGTFTEDSVIDKKKQSVCGECGMSYNDFLKTGYLGCAKCYDEFRNALAPIIYKSQGSVTHTGKQPRITAQDLNRQKAAKLKKELESAVAEERFLDAQRIKDEIDKLTGNK